MANSYPYTAASLLRSRPSPPLALDASCLGRRLPSRTACVGSALARPRSRKAPFLTSTHRRGHSLTPLRSLARGSASPAKPLGGAFLLEPTSPVRVGTGGPRGTRKNRTG